MSPPARSLPHDTFTPDELLDALAEQHQETTHVSMCAGGVRSARVLLRATLAPSACARTAEVALCAGPALALRHVGPSPHEGPARVWLAHDALVALAVPFLTPRDVLHGRYTCRTCRETYADPNPLKVHIYLNCAPPHERAFWREVALRARALCAPPSTPPAQLEALWAEWGAAARGARTHRCVFCGKLCSRRYGLKIHLRTHTGYRPLRCTHCARAFGDPSNLNKHKRLHTRALC